MVLKRFYDDGLAQASYLIGCPGVGEAIVVDPNRHFSTYLLAAEEEDLKIVAVTETHIHADYLSGSRELAQITGAQLFLSAEGGKDWQYEFADSSAAQGLRDGDVLEVGSVRLEVVHTPGHTPEHISFKVTDTATSDQPLGVLSGDFIFVGDVGRPDLLERVADEEGAMEDGAKSLYNSLQKIKGLLPDFALIFPGHGSGSACGKSLGGVPVSSIGYEKQANPAFGFSSETAFVQDILNGQPDPPRYFATMKLLNKTGPPLLGEVAPLRQFGSEALPQAIAETLVIDVREREDYAEAHIPKSLYLPVSRKRFITWAGMTVPYDKPITLISTDREQAELAAARLRLIGLDNVRGWVSDLGGEISLIALQQVTPQDAFLAAEEGRATLVDVREVSEWSEAHSTQAISIPLGQLESKAPNKIVKTLPVAVHCKSGVRSVVASSILERLGFQSIANVSGGFDEYRNVGLPIVNEHERDCG